MTPEERTTCEQFRMALNFIHQNLHAESFDGFFETEIANRLAGEVAAITYGSDDTDCAAWYRAATATQRLLTEPSGETRAEWIEAYAGLPLIEKFPPVQ
jgi:hypothetical protein